MNMLTSRFTAGDIINDGGELGTQYRVDVASPPKSGDSMILQAMVELNYEVPSGTALLSVHGPAGSNPAWSQRPRGAAVELEPLCTFLLDPQPSWFNNSAVLDDRLPLAWQDASRNETNTTLFLIPLDPTVDHSLKILSRDNVSVCVVSGIKTYPFKL